MRVFRVLSVTLAPLSAQGDESVQKLLFLNKRSKSRTAATLVASGPAGVLYVYVCACVCVCVCVCVCKLNVSSLICRLHPLLECLQ